MVVAVAWLTVARLAVVFGLAGLPNAPYKGARSPVEDGQAVVANVAYHDLVAHHEARVRKVELAWRVAVAAKAAEVAHALCVEDEHGVLLAVAHEDLALAGGHALWKGEL